MTRIYHLLSLVLSLCTPALAAAHAPLPKGSVTGQIIDSSSGKPLEFASVTLYPKGQAKAISGDISRAGGRFKLGHIQPGTYILEISFLGYQRLRKPFSISREHEDVKLGRLSLSPDPRQLSDVEVRAERSTIVQQADRKVIHVGKDLVMAGGTAAELMNTLPSVSVDQDGNISLRGDDNVQIFIDGHPSNLPAAQALKQIPSTSIERIELITNPSAKYNPEGMSGIINIVLKRGSQKGFNANLSGNYRYGKHAKYNSAADLNYRVGRFNFFMNYNYADGKYEQNGSVRRPDKGSLLRYNILSASRSQLLKTGFDLYWNRKNTLSLYTDQHFGKQHETNDISVAYSKGDNPDSNRHGESRGANRLQAYDLDYKHEFAKKNHTLEYEINYANYDKDDDSDFRFSPVGSAQDYGDTLHKNHDNTIMNLDYSNPLSKKGRLELGLESRTLHDQNHYRTSSRDLQNADYRYNRYAYAAYADYEQRFDKLSLQLGVRLEHFHVKAQLDGRTAYKDAYTTPYPSAFLTYKSSDENQYQLSYSRRVDRPGLSRVSPIRDWTTPTLISVGNPQLKPQFTHSFEWNYTHQFKRGSLTTSLFYRLINHPISRSMSADPEDKNRAILSYKNFDRRHAYGVEASYSNRFSPWWHMNAGFDL